MATSSNQPLGISLSALASQAGAETSRRTAGGNQQMKAALASAMQQQQGALASQADSQARDQAFQSKDFQDRINAQARADEIKRKFMEEQRRKQEYADFLSGKAQARFQTDENIRQANALMQLEQKYAGDQEDETMPRLSDFGGATISGYRGQALANEGQQFPVSEKERQRVQEILSTLGADPNAVVSELHKKFGNRTRTASTALWELGYLPQ